MTVNVRDLTLNIFELSQLAVELSWPVNKFDFEKCHFIHLKSGKLLESIEVIDDLRACYGSGRLSWQGHQWKW